MLSGKLVTLRELRESDLQYTHKWVNFRELKLHTGPYRPVSEAETKRWYEAVTRDANGHIFIIQSSADDQVFGICSLVNVDPVARKGELRIKVGEQTHWDKGAGTEATRLLVEFGFKDLNLHRIYLHVFANNQRAIHLYEKCGFAREGRLRDDIFLDGQYQDSLVMAIINPHLAV